MNVRIRLWLALGGFVLLWAVRAGAMDDHSSVKAYQGTADFQRVKALAGVWKGTVKMGDTAQDVSVEYRVTAGGSAVQEVLFPGTPHEMLDVYFEQGKKLMLTHYCALGNRPHMALKKSDAREMRFVLSNDPVIDPVRDEHMHSLRITFVDVDHITQEWVSFRRGKENGATVITLSRVPPAPPAAPSMPAEVPVKRGR